MDRFSSFQVKIIVPLSVLIIAIAVFNSIYFSKQQSDLIKLAFQERIDKIADTISLGMGIALSAGDPEVAVATRDLVIGDEDLAFLLIFKGQGGAELISHGIIDSTQMDRGMLLELPLGESREIGDYLVQKNAIHSDGEGIGFSIIGLYKKDRQQAIASHIRITLLGSLVMALVCVLFILYLTKSTVVAPILKLVKAAERLREGDLNQADIQVHSADEIGTLAKAFNSMQEKLRQRHEALRESERRFRSVIEVAPEAIITLDAQGQIHSVNQGFNLLFGYDKEEILGQNIIRLVPKLYSVDQGQDFHRLLTIDRADLVGATVELEGMGKDGRRFPLELSLSSWDTAQGPFYGGIIRDLTERKQAEMQLMQHQKLESIGRLASGIAHEINTPMQFIGDHVRFLKEEVEGVMKVLEQRQESGDVSAAEAEEELDLEFLAEEIPDSFKSVENGIERIVEIVGAMKALAHPTQAKKMYFDLNKVIQDAVTISRNEWKYVADLECDLDPHLPEVPCRPNELGQVFINMIVNGAHAIAETRGEKTEAKGQLHLSTRQMSDWAEVRITDSGQGIPATVQSHIFEPFFTTKEVGKGTGQGLAISHDVIVNKHQGDLSFETRPGQGTTFIIRLPFDDQKTQVESEELS